MSTVDRVDRVDTTEDKTERDTIIHGRHEHDIDLSEYYKKMYENLIEDVRQKQSELQAANYRIGQLEGQIRYSVPLAEYQQEKKQLLTEGLHYKKIAKESELQRELQIKKAHKNFLIERFNKRIYLVIVLALILLQPLWLFLVEK